MARGAIKRSSTKKLPAVVIAAGAVLACAAVGLAIYAKQLVKDGIRGHCALEAGERVWAMHTYLDDRARELAAEQRLGPELLAMWTVSGEELTHVAGEELELPQRLFAAMRHHSTHKNLHVDLGTEAVPMPITFVPPRTVLAWRSSAAAEAAFGATRGGRRFNTQLATGGLETITWPYESLYRLEPPLSHVFVSVGLDDPSAFRRVLRWQTAGVSVLALSVLLVLAGTALSFARRVRRSLRQQQQRDQLFARAYHELQTPLAVMRAAVDTLALEGHGEDGELARCLGMIGAQEQRMRETVRRLLRYLRADADECQRPLGVVVQEEVRSVGALLAQAKIELVVELDAAAQAVGVPGELMGDIVRELLTNVAKHARGASCVQLRGSVRGLQAVLTVTDDGRAQPIAGDSGLGLALIEEGVRLRRGDVHFDSLADGGFRAEVVLPCRKA